jgi:branched-subunit amino acid aminotransferase/4-amino-4-deoxychorismate lyase
MTHVYLNDALVEEAQALISVNDRGFRFGDGVFETIPVYGGLPYLWEYHIQRLAGGLDALRIHYSTENLLGAALLLLKANCVAEGLLRIQISRGTGSRGYLPVSPAPRPTLVLQTRERPAPAGEPATLWLSGYEKISARALPVQFKLAQGLNSILARMDALEHGCHDALQLSAEGYVSEAGAANIFWRKGRALHTPSLSCGALAGITRRRIIELSPSSAREGQYRLADLRAADAVILTNAATLATPVARLSPQANSWESAAFADEINAMINKDILQYTRRMRESLA